MSPQDKKPFHGRVDAREGLSHHDGFNQALDEALKSHTLPPGTHHAAVEFQAELKVTNPGSIGAYMVKVSPLG